MADTKTALGAPIIEKNVSIVLSGMSTVTTTATETVTTTVIGLRVGMIPLVAFRAALTAGFILSQPPWVSAADTLSISLTNVTGGTLTPDDNIADILVP